MDDNLSKWLNGELTNDELIKQVGRDEAMKYIQIVGEVDNWTPDQSQRLFDPKEITSKPKAKVRTMNSWWSYAAAAAVLLTVISYLWLIVAGSTVKHSSQIGEVREVQLPDGVSVVTLAPNSEISWEEDEWEEAIAMKEKRLKAKKARRKVKLKGKALFEVEKGAPFSVESSTGSVEVLGTTFEVDDFTDGINVRCFEGRVEAKPKTAKRSVIINAGEGYLFFRGKWEEKVEVLGSKPDWLQNQTKFENAPLAQVIKSLENIYGISIKDDNVNTTRRFTGTIPNDKLEVALRLVFSPFKISFIQNGKIVTLSED
jgi:ferric-dicitrate binding protein FerR (iron transport regulator)